MAKLPVWAVKLSVEQGEEDFILVRGCETSLGAIETAKQFMGYGFVPMSSARRIDHYITLSPTNTIKEIK